MANARHDMKAFSDAIDVISRLQESADSKGSVLVLEELRNLELGFFRQLRSLQEKHSRKASRSKKSKPEVPEVS